MGFSTGGSHGAAPQGLAPPSGPEYPMESRPWSDLLGSWWSGLSTGSIQVAWLLGRVAVPLSCMALAASQVDVLHGVYLLLMLLSLLAACLALQGHAPAVPAWWLQHRAGTCVTSFTSRMRSSGASTGQHQQHQQPNALPAAELSHHRLLRFYGSCHLLVVYLALVLQLPGLESDLNEYILRLVGLWDPKILSDLLPVLLLLVAATVHVIMGKWLLQQPPAGAWQQQQQQTRPPAATNVPTSRAAQGAAAESSQQQQQQQMLAWLQAIHPKLVLTLVLGCSKLAVAAGAALLVLLVSDKRQHAGQQRQLVLSKCVT